MKHEFGVNLLNDLPDFEAELSKKVNDFRQMLAELAFSENDPNLLDLDTSKLTEIDMVLFDRFRNGTLSLDDIKRQEYLLKNLDEAEPMRQLLAYMRSKLEGKKAA